MTLLAVVKRRTLEEELNDDDNTGSSRQNSPRGVFDKSTSSSSSSGNSSNLSSRLDRSISMKWGCSFKGLLTKKKSMARLSICPPPTPTLGSTRIGINEDRQPLESGEFEEEILMARPSWRSFSYQDLAEATDYFSSDKLIGKGGHAEIYKGRLPDGQLVAVKRLTKGRMDDERIGDFLSELGIIAHVNHPNAVQLLGFSEEGGLYLVLQYSPHGCLASVLHGSKEILQWKVRFMIASGIAEGLHYLHERCQRHIVHRDIKASNILLTDDYQPQISDFGLAKWLPDKGAQQIVFPIEGTFGYMAPECFMHGVVSEKIDVFAYGVLLLELITGRRAIDSSQKSLVIWAKPLLEANNLKELIDPSLGDAYDPDELNRVVSAASMCIRHQASTRPTMNQVARVLRGEEGCIEPIDKAPRSTEGRPSIFGSGDEEDYSYSKYIDDLNKHTELALEQWDSSMSFESTEYFEIASLDF